MNYIFHRPGNQYTDLCEISLVHEPLIDAFVLEIAAADGSKSIKTTLSQTEVARLWTNLLHTEC